MVGSLGLAGMARFRSIAVENRLLLFRNRGRSFDSDDLVGVGFTRENPKSLGADGGPYTSLEDVPVVVEDLLPGAFVEDGVAGFHTGSFFAFSSDDCNRSKFDSLYDGEGFGLPFIDLDAVEACLFETL
jgi:hypothetical protein